MNSVRVDAITLMLVCVAMGMRVHPVPADYRDHYDCRSAKTGLGILEECLEVSSQLGERCF